MWELVEDTMNLGRNRRLATDVEALASLITDGRAGAWRYSRARSMSEALDQAKRMLRDVVEDRLRSEPTAKFRIRWRAKEPPRAAAPAAAPPAIDAKIIEQAIDLCDWVDRVREDERIAPERGAQVTVGKCAALLARLGIERIDGRGPFDARVQQIVDSAATDSPELDMHVCQTVECGYRTGERLIRPQRVIVNRFSGASKKNV